MKDKTLEDLLKPTVEFNYANAYNVWAPPQMRL